MHTLLFLLAGCPYLDAEDYASIRDVDGDGVEAIRFGGRDCDDHDPSFADCDADRDGVRSLAGGGDDCDDTSTAVFPGAVEICDGIDNDCDGRIDDDDDGVVGAPAAWVDADGDGFGAGEAFASCVTDANTVRRDGDCDDTLDSVNPSREELCDGVDRNCDGDPMQGAVREWFDDADGDGFGAGVVIATTCTPPSADAVQNSNDCDDADPLAHPTDPEVGDPTEICDGIDNDCDGRFDDDDDDFADPASVARFRDLDGDGFGDISTASQRCPGEDPGWVGNDLDCDDDDPLGRPGAAPTFSSQEVCDGFDNDCNGLVDEADPGIDAATVFTAWPDFDLDGFGDPDGATRTFCTLPAAYSRTPTDCDDADSDRFPTNPERCGDGRDNDCDTLIDSRDPDSDGPFTWYRDADNDGVGVLGDSARSCDEESFGPEGYSPYAGDCDDTDGTVTVEQLWHWDGDGDGFGNDTVTADDPEPIPSCFRPPNRVTNNRDCDDDVGSINPNAAELCNELDDDCDGVVDNQAAGSVYGYVDHDGDGFGAGTPEEAAFLCTNNQNVAVFGGDCADDDPARHPGAREACGEDRDCDGQLGDDTTADVLAFTWYPDNDFDGFGDASDPTQLTYQCAPPPRSVREGTDCDDTDPSRYFASYVLDPDLDQGSTRSSLQSILDHPARCAATPTTIRLAADVQQHESLNLAADTGSIVIDGDGHRLCWASDTSLRVSDTELTVSDIEWVHALPGANGPTCEADTDPADDVPVFAVEHGATLHLNGVRLRDQVLGAPLVGHLFQAPGDSLSVSLEGVELSDLTLHGPLLTGVFAEVQLGISSTSISGLTLSTPDTALLDLRTSPGTIDIRNSDFDQLDVGGPLVHTIGPSTVVLGLNRFTDIRLADDHPVLCLNGPGCTPGDEPSVDPNLSGQVDLDGNLFARVTDDTLDAATLVWMPDAFHLDTSHNTVRESVGGQAPIVRFVGVGSENGQGWTSVRDRFIQTDGGLVSDNGRHTFVESSVISSTFPVQSTAGVLTMDRTWILDSSVEREAEETRGSDNLYVDSAWSTTTTTAEFGPDYVFTGTTRSTDCFDGGGLDNGLCLDLDPALQPLVSYHPSLPYERMLPVPLDNDGFAGSPFLYDNVTWSQDPNVDGLPVAWLVFHANTPECRRLGDGLFDPDDDPDLDGPTNAQEWLAGTWPCVADTDGDNVAPHNLSLDGNDSDPLNPGLR